MYGKFTERAKKITPGGIMNTEHAPFNNLKLDYFIDCAKGANIYDLNGKMFIDYNLAGASAILGHNHPTIYNAVLNAAKKGINFNAPVKEQVFLSEIIVEMVPNIEMVRIVNSASEAFLCAVKLAKTYTNKNKIVVFNGHKHTLTGDITFENITQDKQNNNVLFAQYNDIDAVKMLFSEHSEQIAAVVVEPVATDISVVAPQNGFLSQLHELCKQNNALLVFDEIITGFRLCAGGAQEYYGVPADIVVMGSVIGGGFPIGVFAAKKEIMNSLAPIGSMYQSDAMSPNHVVMAASITVLRVLRENNAVYAHINNAAQSLQNGIKKLMKINGINAKINRVGSIFSICFCKNEINNFEDLKAANSNAYNVFYNFMLNNNICFANSQNKAMYLSAAHTPLHINKTLEIVDEALSSLKNKDLFR